MPCRSAHHATLLQRCLFSAALRTHTKLLLSFSELAKLELAAKTLLAAWKQSLEHDCTQGSISPRLHSGADVARNRAVATQGKWGAHKREGGLYWSTYKVRAPPSSHLSVPHGADKFLRSD